MDVERLRRLPLFGELDHHDLSQLLRWVREVDFADGDRGRLPIDRVQAVTMNEQVARRVFAVDHRLGCSRQVG